ncbi:MAG: SNF2-related protein [Bacteroidales bacterium]|nr:SNF2-related protein [Bacteroidales bacterium]MDD4107195.1 SNF2-related protein [Prolixibacteraceae bacterium]
MLNITKYQAKYFANYLTRKLPANDLSKLTASLHDAQVDLTPHQIEAALFAFKSPLSNGAILADEVGLGKTIEAGIILSQHWAEHKRILLIITPANLRKQWASELQDKFFLPSVILEARNFNEDINSGNLNPFEKEKIIICSFQFARSKAPYLKHTPWNLVVVDEAHRLRNVYKPTNKIANTIKDAIESRKKVLLTATPLQNSILELYGLVSIIDNYVFGDLKSFKGQFSKVLDETDFQSLRSRLQPVCKRTLRRQVLEYIKYTKRIAIREEFYPGENEQKLYDLVSAYLQRPKLYALPNSQRQLMTLILRKLLASSTYAIYGTLCSLISRLEDKLLQNQPVGFEDLALDFEARDEEVEEWIEDEEAEDEDSDEILHPNDIAAIKAEVEDLKQFRDLAAKISKNSKAEQLFIALNKGFEQLEKLGANRKALLFTESKRTQDFLYELLENRGYRGKVVLFNGTNSDKQSTAIYKEWLIKHKGSNKITGSPTADRRAAIVEHFCNEATIMIATEAAAEGINLQFCSLIVNYDMPWNPQRIEQRIGRCHRYGQKYDVVVINFLNKKNAADVRVYELLDEKFQLFSGVFGASDEVLGSIGSGVDFEKRIAQIYNECRTTDEIEQAFDALQNELQEQISDKMLNARSTLLENFDDSVREKLRINLRDSLLILNTFERYLWITTCFSLKEEAIFDDTTYCFHLNKTKNMVPSLSGHYCMVMPKEGVKKSNVVIPEKAQVYRIGHPLAQAVMEKSKEAPTPPCEIVFDYSRTQAKVTLLEEHIGQEGWMRVERLSINSFEEEDHLLISCVSDNGSDIYPEVAERMFSLSALEGETVDVPVPVLSLCRDSIEQQKERILSESELRNRNFFDNEMEKLDTWADDMKLSLEKEITDLDAEIKLRKSEAKKMLNLEAKIVAQRSVKDLEKRRTEKRMKLYQAQDEIDEKKETLLSNIEKMLAQKISQEELFTIKWRIK